MKIRYTLAVSVLFLGLLVGCSDDSSPSRPSLGDVSREGEDVGGDARGRQDVHADAAPGDDAADPDTVSPGDARDEEVDAQVPPLECAQPPAIQIAGTPAGDALADSAAQCGQPAFAWLRGTAQDSSQALATMTERGFLVDYPAILLERAVEELGAASPREIAHDVRLVQYGYMTQDRGELIEASAMIAFPRGRRDLDPPKDVILLLHGTSGFNDACAATDDPAYQGLAAIIASFGYVVVAPDYIGLKAVGEPTGFIHPYLVGQATAIASMDAVRAAMRLPSELRGGWCLTPRVAVVGGSQGGHAALWVDRLAPHYARELEITGVVATVPPADMVGQLDRALKDFVNATKNSVAFYGASAGWYGVEDRLDEIFVSPFDVQVPQTLASSCNYKDTLSGAQTPGDIFQPALIDAAQQGTLADVEPWGCIAAENGLTTTTIARSEPGRDSYGILYVLGENDELVHTPIERDSFETLCAQGMRMDFLECAGARHGETTVLALPEILEFVDARLAGEAFESAKTCVLSAPVTCRGVMQD